MKQTILLFLFYLPLLSWGETFLTIEAEDCQFDVNAEIQHNDNASNGTFIKLNPGLSLTLTLTLTLVEIPTEGEYQLQIFHFNGGVEQPFSLKVNDADFEEKKLNPSNWAYQGTANATTFSIDLKEGDNTIQFYLPSGSALLLDYFNVFNVDYERQPTTFYFSNDGDDVNDGSIDAPFKSLAKATQIANALESGGRLQPGDQILFKKGDTFEGYFEVKCMGSKEAPITISSYGEGELPILSGSGNIEGGDYMETIKYVNASHVIMSDIWVKNDRQNYERYTHGRDKSFGILVVANQWGNSISKDLSFLRIKVSDVFGESIPEEFNSYNVTGLRFESESNTDGKEVTIRDVHIEDCYFTNIGKAGVWSIHKGTNTEVDSVNRSINFVIKNNIFYKTGGSGIILSKVHNALVENNLFDHSGHSRSEEPRLVGRGSGMWVFSARNILAQYNSSYSIRGKGDSYGMHIDFNNKNIIYQYNYSEDSEGGFVEVLGNNHNVTYRFCVSVNDSFRDHHGSTLWTSGFVGSKTVDGQKVPNDPIPSDGVYIYNNTVYLNNHFTPSIRMFSKNTYIYNNIFVHEGNGSIGEVLELDMQGDFIVSNNLYFGDIKSRFTSLDKKPYYGHPKFIDKGVSYKEGYQISDDSKAINGGKSFPEPEFPFLGKGIFKDIPLLPNQDTFGNSMDITHLPPNIGADNNYNSDEIPPTSSSIFNNDIKIFPNPNNGLFYVNNTSIDGLTVEIYSISGQKLVSDILGIGETKIQIPEGVYGIMMVKLQKEKNIKYYRLIVNK
ncbi:T9SS type A sorting domain-containing protein [Flammeovirga sp. MY04]|uniref:T9SS type A sorting domain-containing protein n=1 Tax=Flammeovirga sp. MY04 TaxID=1191459 RepID=UPI0008062E49|nr:T9SS type A sorting domain-containing protein [Flammeovirga sp. MY04]ANQ51455.1 T9SS type A sorting domain-containing protein [Flammeovirga sp. MY04]